MYGYKRQMEFYQWLFRKNGFKVSDTGYFVYANASRDREAFDGKLEFDVKVIPYTGSDAWVEGALTDAKQCLLSETSPDSSSDCDYCRYRRAVGEVLKEGAPQKDKTQSPKKRKNPGTLF